MSLNPVLARMDGLFRTPGRRALGATGALLAACGGLTGCEVDSYLDPSRVGRWEMTATTVPILDRLSIIEQAGEDEVEFSDVTPEDLIPEIEEYRLGPGDQVEITFRDLFVRGVTERFVREIDRRGYVDLPQIGEVYVGDMTRERVQRAVANAAIERGIIQRDPVQDPVISVVVLSPRKQTFTVIGSVQAAGTFSVPKTDFRMLEALGVVGAFNEDAEYIYVIRHIPLTEEAAGRPRPPQNGRTPVPTPEGGEQPPAGDDLLKIIDDLSGPEPTPPDANQPRREPARTEPQQPPSDDPPPIDLPGGPSVFDPGGAVVRRQPENERSQPPAVLLIEDRRPGAPQPEPKPPTALSPEGSQWMYLDGKWVMVKRKAIPPEAQQAGVEPPLMTQRVIRVPVKPLLAGDARYNIVIRPGDTIRVPRLDSGTFFLMGEIARGGSFTLTEEMTLTRAIATAGGLANLAIPERVDLTRMVGKDRQATVRLNLRAIHEGTQPDIYLKDNDLINIGTNFWAVPLAVVRGGFRMTYGFGFLLDRNFGNDVFGAPPTNRNDL